MAAIVSTMQQSHQCVWVLITHEGLAGRFPQTSASMHQATCMRALRVCRVLGKGETGRLVRRRWVHSWVCGAGHLGTHTEAKNATLWPAGLGSAARATTTNHPRYLELHYHFHNGPWPMARHFGHTRGHGRWCCRDMARSCRPPCRSFLAIKRLMSTLEGARNDP